jgi:predicted nucleic acid-binding protein
VAVVVFDADVLIGFLERRDGNHARAVECVAAAQAAGDRRCVAAVKRAEVLVLPHRRGDLDVRRVERFVEAFGFDIVVGDRRLASHAASVRAKTGLRLPHAFAVATALRLGAGVDDPARLESFDSAVLRAHATLTGAG